MFVATRTAVGWQVFSFKIEESHHSLVGEKLRKILFENKLIFKTRFLSFGAN